MDKISGGARKKYLGLFVIDCLLLLINLLLFSFSVISLLLFIIILSCLLVAGVVLIVLYIKSKKIKVQNANAKLANIIITDQDIINLFNKTGIPIIYDENGKLKDVFQLLGIEPIYDENGNRILTIYERIGIVPRFNKEGKEIPTFLSIKNRVRAFVKPEKQTGTLKRVLTEQEKEELLLRQMLEQKLKESEEKGDTKKTKVIKKVIEQKKKEKAEAPKKQGYIKLGKAAKPIGNSKVKVTKPKQSGFNPIADIATLFNYGEKIRLPHVKYNIKTGSDNKQAVKGFSIKIETPEKPEKPEKPQKPKPVVTPVIVQHQNPKQSFLGNLSSFNKLGTGLNNDNSERNQ